MKKVTIKLSDGRNIEEVIELKNINSEDVFMRLKDVIIREMMDSNIDKRKSKESEIRKVFGDTDGDIVESDVIIPQPRRVRKCKVVVRNIGRREIRLSEPVSKLFDEGKVHLEPVEVKDENEIKEDAIRLGIVHDNKPTVSSLPETKDYVRQDSENSFFMISKCPACGKPSFYKTWDGARFTCACGHSQPNSDFLRIEGQCPNCSNNIGSRAKYRVGTLKGMDVSDVMNCKRCDSPVSMEYIEKKKAWKIM